MTTIALESLSKTVRDQVLRALQEPVLLTDDGKPLLVIQSLLDDEAVDDLIAQHPAFRASIERARQQKAAGKVKTLAELREKYKVE